MTSIHSEVFSPPSLPGWTALEHVMVLRSRGVDFANPMSLYHSIKRFPIDVQQPRRSLLVSSSVCQNHCHVTPLYHRKRKGFFRRVVKLRSFCLILVSLLQFTY